MRSPASRTPSKKKNDYFKTGGTVITAISLFTTSEIRKMLATKVLQKPTSQLIFMGHFPLGTLSHGTAGMCLLNHLITTQNLNNFFYFCRLFCCRFFFSFLSALSSHFFSLCLGLSFFRLMVFSFCLFCRFIYRYFLFFSFLFFLFFLLCFSFLPFFFCSRFSFCFFCLGPDLPVTSSFPVSYEIIYRFCCISSKSSRPFFPTFRSDEEFCL